MTETYTSGTWIVKPGDLDHPSRYVSFAPRESSEAQQARKALRVFRERIGRVRAWCEDFQPSTHELVVAAT